MCIYSLYLFCVQHIHTENRENLHFLKMASLCWHSPEQPEPPNNNGPLSFPFLTTRLHVLPIFLLAASSPFSFLFMQLSSFAALFGPFSLSSRTLLFRAHNTYVMAIPWIFTYHCLSPKRNGDRLWRTRRIEHVRESGAAGFTTRIMRHWIYAVV